MDCPTAVMVGEGRPSTSLLIAARKHVDADPSLSSGGPLARPGGRHDGVLANGGSCQERLVQHQVPIMGTRLATVTSANPAADMEHYRPVVSRGDAASAIVRNACIKSSGNGNTMVELRSLAISLSVPR
jgi:hypothetical protein